VSKRSVGGAAVQRMDFNKLEIFIAVCRYLNFTETAKHLYISQSSVSHSICEIEKELDVKLFDRTKRGVALTLAGEVLLEEAVKVVTIMQGVRSKINGISFGESGELRIGFASELMVDPLVPYLEYFCEKYHNINFLFRNYDSISILRQIKKGELDIGFDSREIFAGHDAINWRYLFRNPINVVLSLNHRLAKKKKITLDMLVNDPIILVSHDENPGFFEIIQNMFAAKGLTPILNATPNDKLTMVMMVRIGMGITLLSTQFMKLHNFENIAVVPLDEEFSYFDIGAAWNKKTTNPAVRLFLNEMNDYINKLPNQSVQF
jgi:DNA-binding transcriptional LysR family regulator